MRGLILIAMTLGTATAYADTPYYVGGGLGYTEISQDLDLQPVGDGFNVDNDFDDYSTGFTLFAGYEITPRWAVEAGYIDFGDADDSGRITADIPGVPNPIPGGDPWLFEPTTIDIGASNLKFETDGYYVNGQYHFPVGDSLSLDLLAGWFWGDSRATLKLSGETVSDSSSDSGAMVGGGLTFKITDVFYVRGTLTYFQVDFDGVIDDPYRAGVDLVWDF